MGRLVQPEAEAIEIEVDDGGRVEREQLAHQQAADDGDPQRMAQLGTLAAADRQRQGASMAASVVIVIGRNRSRQHRG